MSEVFTRYFDVTFKNGNTTKAMIVSNGSADAKPKSVVELDGSIWRYRRQLVDKNTGEHLPEYLYFQDNSVQKIEPAETFFAAA